MNWERTLIWTLLANLSSNTVDSKELEGTKELESLELACEPDTATIQQLNNTFDDMDIRYGARLGHYNLRPLHKRYYGHLILNIMTQYHVNRGLKMFGEQGEAAALSEFQQFHVQNVIETMHEDKISEKNHADALQYQMFLKQKQTGIIKGSGFVYGVKNVYT